MDIKSDSGVPNGANHFSFEILKIRAEKLNESGSTLPLPRCLHGIYPLLSPGVRLEGGAVEVSRSVAAGHLDEVSEQLIEFKSGCLDDVHQLARCGRRPS